MVHLNGNVPNINLGLSVGLMAMMAFGIVIGGIYIDDTHKSSDRAAFHAEQTRKDAAVLKKEVSTFINNWNERVKISNVIQNESRERQLDILQKFNQTLFIQLENEKQLKEIGNEIKQNLTAHRTIANQTRDKIIDLQNSTQHAIDQNSAILNELAKAENITITEKANNHENTKDIEQLKALLGNLLNNSNSTK